MEIIQIILIGIVAALLYLVVKDFHPSIAFLIVLLTSVIILLIIIKQLRYIIQLIQLLGNKAMIQQAYLATILKIIGIAYITELGASITNDAGLPSLATKIELAGKIFILLLAIPIITAVVEVIIEMIPFTESDLFIHDR